VYTPVVDSEPETDFFTLAQTLDIVMKEVSRFVNTLHSEIWKDTKLSNNILREDKDHNYKPQHFAFHLCPYLLNTEVCVCGSVCVHIYIQTN